MASIASRARSRFALNTYQPSAFMTARRRAGVLTPPTTMGGPPDVVGRGKASMPAKST